ncbi:hypothetical protein HYDPIDRAFT_167012 [Hydnomerulius pinastri MD-312]|nr:hypothetical protein HYDPIDRAFT_167012 [Hydnomerulius pinastri MD-312]
MLPERVPRKYVDLIRQMSNKWPNWDPSNPPKLIEWFGKVGSYGQVNFDTGALDVEGNVYDPDFQKYVDDVDGRIKMTDCPPLWGDVEEDIVLSTIGLRDKDLKPGPDVPFSAVAASLKREWTFQKGRHGALLVVHKPRQEFLPPKTVLNELYKIPMLKDKLLITRVTHCPAYLLYLSGNGKYGETVSLALSGSESTGSGEPPGFEWWVNTERENLRKGCSKDGEYSFTPLYDLHRKIPLIRRQMRDSPKPDPEPENFWIVSYQPWQPLNNDGEEEPVYEYEAMEGSSFLMESGLYDSDEE